MGTVGGAFDSSKGSRACDTHLVGWNDAFGPLGVDVEAAAGKQRGRPRRGQAHHLRAKAARRRRKRRRRWPSPHRLGAHGAEDDGHTLGESSAHLGQTPQPAKGQPRMEHREPAGATRVIASLCKLVGNGYPGSFERSRCHSIALDAIFAGAHEKNGVVGGDFRKGVGLGSGVHGHGDEDGAREEHDASEGLTVGTAAWPLPRRENVEPNAAVTACRLAARRHHITPARRTGVHHVHCRGPRVGRHKGERRESAARVRVRRGPHQELDYLLRRPIPQVEGRREPE
jgi:hypothetical protein